MAYKSKPPDCGKGRFTKVMKMSQFKTLALGLTTVCTCFSTLAAIETETISFNSGNPSSLSGSYADFNSSLGTLTGVEITLTTYDTVQALVYSLGGSSTVSDVFVQNGSETVSAFGYSLTGTSLATTPYSGTVSQGLTEVPGSTTTEFSQTFQATDLSSFIGTGSATTVISISPGTGLYSGVGTGSAVFFGGEYSSYGTIEIDYLYTASVASIPETRGFPLITAGAAGFAGLCGMVRRNRRAKV
jgi:hypothetical protein